jgi:hypothetical protein
MGGLKYSPVFGKVMPISGSKMGKKEGTKRLPRGYDGTQSTNREMRKILPRILGQIGELHRERPDLILAAWPEIIGGQLAQMTKAVSFEEGVLFVKVNNSTLYSVLSQHEKGRLVKCLRERFPAVEIKNIVFRLG